MAREQLHLRMRANHVGARPSRCRGHGCDVEMEWTFVLAVLSSLVAAALWGFAKLLLGKRAGRKLDAAVAQDDTAQALRDSIKRLDGALHPIPTPAREAGARATNTAMREWKNGLSVAMTHLQFTIPNYPQRPITDPALLGRIEELEMMAHKAVAELGQQNDLWGLSGDTTIGIGTKWGYELLAEARFVLDCYETALREHLLSHKGTNT